MVKQEKVKHHYLPEVYLKGFTPEGSNKIFVLKKPRGKINQMHPAQIMYKRYLYTVEGFENSQMIEDFYQEVENELSEAFKVVAYLKVNPIEYSSLKNQVPFHQLIKSIIAFQFWRSPSQKRLAKELSEQLPSIYQSLPESIGSSIGLNSSYIDYLYKNRHDEAHQKLIQNIVLPVLTFRMYDDTLIDFSFFVAENDGDHVLTSDNPIVFDSLEHLFSFDSFAFALTKDILVASNSLKKGFTINEFNERVAKQAEERVVGASKELLESVKPCCGI